MSITSTVVFESNAPVGSSASSIFGFETMALAMATLCFCPPDISFGRCCAHAASPIRSSCCIASRLRSLLLTPL